MDLKLQSDAKNAQFEMSGNRMKVHAKKRLKRAVMHATALLESITASGSTFLQITDASAYLHWLQGT